MDEIKELIEKRLEIFRDKAKNTLFELDKLDNKMKTGDTISHYKDIYNQIQNVNNNAYIWNSDDPRFIHLLRQECDHSYGSHWNYDSQDENKRECKICLTTLEIN